MELVGEERRQWSGRWLPSLQARELRVIQALAEAAMPPGRFLEGGGERTAAAVMAWLDQVPTATSRALQAGYLAAEVKTLATHGRTFSSLSLDARTRILH